MAKTLERHPFTRRLLKNSISTIVKWNVVMLCIFGTITGGFILFSGFAILAYTDDSEGTSYSTLYGEGERQLLSIPITGVILGTNLAGVDPSLVSTPADTYGYDVKAKLEAAAEDDTVEGVILEINSPGGTIYGANAIADAVKLYREKTKRPVYAHVESLGASAAYWAAASADKIFVDYGSEVGSIGVILGPFQYFDKVLAVDGGAGVGGVITQNGIEETYITAGKSKDAGYPHRRLTPEEVKLMQAGVNIEYDNFVSYVSKRRAIPGDTIRNQLGALTYDGKTATENKLADGVGNKQQAYQALAKAANIPLNDYSIVHEEPASYSLYDSLTSAFNRKPQPQAKATDLCPLTKLTLAYHGDTSQWCVKAKQ